MYTVFSTCYCRINRLQYGNPTVIKCNYSYPLGNQNIHMTCCIWYLLYHGGLEQYLWGMQVFLQLYHIPITFWHERVGWLKKAFYNGDCVTSKAKELDVYRNFCWLINNDHKIAKTHQNVKQPTWHTWIETFKIKN